MTFLIRLSAEDIELLTDCLDEILHFGAIDTFPHKYTDINNMITYLNSQVTQPVAETASVGPVLLCGGLMDNEILDGLGTDN